MAARTTTGEIVEIKGGEFLMGSNDFYPEERPARRVRVESFAIDCCPVTNAEFARFVEATGYVTVAERPIDPAQYPGASPRTLCSWFSRFSSRARPDEPCRLVAMVGLDAWCFLAPPARSRIPQSKR